jgi:type II secretory pathway pseudopilin PulG
MIRQKTFFTLIEIMVATAIIGTMVLSIAEFMSSQQRYINHNKEKKFALLKANQILNELRTFIEDSGETSGHADTLDRLTNLKPHPLLTIMPMPELSQSDYKIVLSNNLKMNESDAHLRSWKYLRTIQVAPIGIGGTRQITVKIYRGSDFNDFPANDLKTPLTGVAYPRPIISLITVLPTIGDIDFEAQQVYDYYNIAIENIPGWWVHMGQLLPVAQGALDYVDSVNDGMTIRNHWITKLGYGRDKFYAPYLNIVNDTYQEVDNAYFYPGKLPNGFGKPEYYVPSLMKCHMQSDVNSPTTAISYINGYQAFFTSELLALDPAAVSTAWNQYNPYPYAPADYLNNPMRYPDMKKLYELRNYEAKRAWYHKNIDRNPEKNPGLNEISREDNPDFANVEDYFTRLGTGEEMPWALLLDELSMNPEKFRNSIFLNLHGELLPMPTVRNYSDAAFSSTGVNIQHPLLPNSTYNTAAVINTATTYEAGRYTYFRVNAHPERIRNHAKNLPGVTNTAADNTSNVDTQNPFLRVYGYLTEAINSGTWRASGANSADGSSGVKKERLDDVDESPITISIRFHKGTYNTNTGDNTEFNAWRDVLTKAAAMMRNDRYISFFEGGTSDLNGKYVYYGTNYTSANWGTFLTWPSPLLPGTLDYPTEANEGWGYLNHSLATTDANAAKSISQDNFRAKGLGVEPLGLKYAPYFFLDYSLDSVSVPAKTQWNNMMYFHQRDTSKIHYNATDTAVVATAANYTTSLTNDLGLNVDYIVGATSPTNATHVPNNIIKASGSFAPVLTVPDDIHLSGFNVARTTNPAGWTQHFIGVEQGIILPTYKNYLPNRIVDIPKGSSEWFAFKASAGLIPSAPSNGYGVMKFWTGTSYDETVARYSSFARRNYLRGISMVTTDAMLEEGSPNYWHFALIGPDNTYATNPKYEMLYLSDKNWVPIAPSLNYPTQKVAWDDTMNWSFSGTTFFQLNASKTPAAMLALINLANPIPSTGRYLITNTVDAFWNSHLYDDDNGDSRRIFWDTFCAYKRYGY